MKPPSLLIRGNNKLWPGPLVRVRHICRLPRYHQINLAGKSLLAGKLTSICVGNQGWLNRNRCNQIAAAEKLRVTSLFHLGLSSYM